MAKLVHHFYCSGYLGCSLFTLQMIEEEDGHREGNSKNLEQEETIINLGPDQEAIEEFRLALPGLQGQRLLLGRAPFARQNSQRHHTADNLPAPLQVENHLKRKI